MQLVLKFKCDRLELPIHYNHIIQGFIYSNLSNKDFREFLHEEGFKENNRRFKLFTFSKLIGRYEIDKLKKTITFLDSFNLVVCSIVDDFINDLAKTCLLSENLHLNNQKISLIGIDTSQIISIEPSVKVATLSPIVTYSTVNIEGRKRTIYHSPEDAIFQKHIKENLIKKANAIGESLDSNTNFEINILDEGKLKESPTYFKDIYIKGYSGVFEIKGNTRLINLALNCGIGAKNSQGFGCLELVK